MKIDIKETPREFKVGKENQITLKDMGSVYLNPNEQITFRTEEGSEYDVCRKEWGYYATPSMNDRLKRFGFKTALVRNKRGQMYTMVVFEDRRNLFLEYLKEEDNHIVQWLDEEPLEKPSC